MSKLGLEEKANNLIKAFEHFEIDAKIVAVTVSKNIATFEFVTYRRQRILEILNLAEEIRYFAREDKLRVVLSGYGENHFGVELPIDDVGEQNIEELYKATTFNNPSMLLPVYIGTDTHNRMLYDDLYCISNLLVAGNSGTGKTAFLNSVITSIIMAKTSDEARFVIFDPKGCEWDWIDRLPHIESTVIRGISAGNEKIKQLITELDRRQELLATTARKNVVDYNENEPIKLPHLIVLFDEISDYLRLGDEDFEKDLSRLLMRGRGVGMHFVISSAHTTERIITPIIKAHCLAQMAFHVDSAEDSELIIDLVGAENLCRVGDAFYKSLYHPTISRIHTAHMDEIVVKTIIPKKHSAKITNSHVDKMCDDAAENKFEGNADRQIIRREEFRKMLKHCLETGSVSTRELQMEFDIGYGKAARYSDLIKMILQMDSKKQEPFE